ncbi:hypothetical protein C8Q72DRAFT_847719, partial [Fomitopsis betulina]
MRQLVRTCKAVPVCSSMTILHNLATWALVGLMGACDMAFCCHPGSPQAVAALGFCEASRCLVPFGCSTRFGVY